MMKTKLVSYQRLKLISPPQTKVRSNLVLRQWLKQLYQVLVAVLVSKDEPRIETRVDRQGKTYWYIFDPVTRQTFSFDSEAEVRRWIDRRYYRAELRK